MSKKYIINQVSILLIFIFTFVLLSNSYPLYSSSPDYIEKTIKKAKEYSKKGKYKKALKKLERALKKAKNNDTIIQIYMEIAYVRFLKKDFIFSEYYLNKIILYDKNIEKISKSYSKEFVELINNTKNKTYKNKNIKENKHKKNNQIIIKKYGIKKKKKFPVFKMLLLVGAVYLGYKFIIKKDKENNNNDDSNQDTTIANEVYNSIEWVTIPAGKFFMGDNGNEVINKETLHEIYLDTFEIAIFEITHEKYIKFLNDVKVNVDGTYKGRPLLFRTDPLSSLNYTDQWMFRSTSRNPTENTPVGNLTWYGAYEFCEWLSIKTGNKITLPTEAQWEKSARGTDQRRYPWGNTAPNSTRCNFGGSGILKPVGTYPAGVSPYGVHDMAGNVKEWCNDYYEEDYYANSPENNPQGPLSGDMRIIRGGGFGSSKYSLYTYRRSAGIPHQTLPYWGFRVVKNN